MKTVTFLIFLYIVFCQKNYFELFFIYVKTLYTELPKPKLRITEKV